MASNWSERFAMRQDTKGRIDQETERAVIRNMHRRPRQRGAEFDDEVEGGVAGLYVGVVGQGLLCLDPTTRRLEEKDYSIDKIEQGPGRVVEVPSNDTSRLVATLELHNVNPSYYSGEAHSVCVYDVRNRSVRDPICVFAAPTRSPADNRFDLKAIPLFSSSDKSRIVVASGYWISVHDARSGKRRESFPASYFQHSQFSWYVSGLYVPSESACSPRLYCCSGFGILGYDLVRGGQCAAMQRKSTKIPSEEPRENIVCRMAMDEIRGILFGLGLDGVQAWDIRSGKMIDSFEGREMRQFAVSRDGGMAYAADKHILVVGARGGFCWIGDLRKTKTRRREKSELAQLGTFRIASNSGHVADVCRVDDDYFASVSWDRRVSIFNIMTQKIEQRRVLRKKPGFACRPQSVCFIKSVSPFEREFGLLEERVSFLSGLLGGEKTSIAFSCELICDTGQSVWFLRAWVGWELVEN